MCLVLFVWSQDDFVVTPESVLQAAELRFFRVLVANIKKVMRVTKSAR